VVVTGGGERTGAACLAAHAAQKAGAGAVTIASPEAAALGYKTFRASIMVETWGKTETLKSILRDSRKNTLVLGPGIGTGTDQKDVVETVLAFDRPGVLDGDIFTLFQDDPQNLFSYLSPEKHVLTPHEGEFSRLFPDIASG